MNRQTKRMLQRQGQITADGSPVAPESSRPAPRPASERLSPAEYFRQVRSELRKVAWPTRAEVVSFTIVVLVALIVFTAVIFGLDSAFGKAVVFLFG
ncbi:MAG: preprotein translocase subunit SecE [Acidimicrobiales bacterium]